MARETVDPKLILYRSLAAVVREQLARAKVETHQLESELALSRTECERLNMMLSSQYNARTNIVETRGYSAEEQRRRVEQVASFKHGDE